MAAFDEATIAEYTRAGWWDDDSVADIVARHALSNPDGLAFIAHDRRLTWHDYDELSTRLASALLEAGCPPGGYLGVMLPDSALVHIAFVAAEKAGLILLGIGPRTGVKEMAHIVNTAAAQWILTAPVHRGVSTSELISGLRPSAPTLEHHLTIEWAGPELELSGKPLPEIEPARQTVGPRRIGPNDLFCVNSTSGTTGLPKCVMQTQNIWKYFGPLAAEAGQFGPDEIFMSLLPAPFGFGLWTGHIVPAMFGRPTVLLPDFEVGQLFAAIEREKVTVLGAVSSQFVMMLNSPLLGDFDLSSLRVMFTGGERVPPERAAEFEERTGCSVLQFYGSNEAGPISVTRVGDSRENRLTTSGRVIPEMRPRLIGLDGQDVTSTGGPGQCAAKGPGLTPGYLNDPEGNTALFRPDGWLVTGDLATIDEDGYLRIAGRVSDFIIRGGHNVSAIMIEDELVSHPRIAQVAAVAAPDDTLGERVCVYIVAREGAELTLDDLRAHLRERGVSKNDWPELVVNVPELPVAPGGKVRKSDLRDDIKRRLILGEPAGR
jgi:acyl-CoA synthetase